MPVIYVPRLFGGTLIINTGPTSPTPVVSVLVTFRDGETQVKFRDGKVQAQFRDGKVQVGSR